MRALVTGATGFVGLALCRTLKAAGHDVGALVRSSSQVEPLRDLGIALFRGDMNDISSLDRAVDGQDIVFHNAAAVGDWGTRAHFFAVNVDGTRNLVHACRRQAGIRLVHSSSLTVLGIPHNGERIDESRAYDSAPRLAYVASKIAAEQEIMAAWHKVAATIVRPAAIWGPGDKVFLPRWQRLARRNLMINIGAGDNHVGMTHINNFVHALSLVASSPTSARQIYHITDAVDPTSREVFTALSKAFGFAPPRFSVPVSVLRGLSSAAQQWSQWRGSGKAPLLTPYAVELLSCDARYAIDKAQQELGYAPVISFDQAVAELASRFNA